MDNGGDAVVLWADSQTSGSNGLPVSPWNLDFQLYKNQTSNGVNSLTAGSAGSVASVTVYDASVSPTWVGHYSMVSMAPTTGNFVIAWSTQSSDRYGHILYSTYARVYSADGSPATGPILVGGSGDHRIAGVAMSDSGFDVLYGSFKDSGGFINPAPTWTVQRYSASGGAEGKPISITTTNNSSTSASISTDAAGDFVVGWSDSGSSGTPTYIDAQRYTGSGKAQGSVIQINTTAFAFDVDLAMDANDDFVIAWLGTATADGYPNDRVDSDDVDLLTAAVHGGSNAVSGPTVAAGNGVADAAVAIQPSGGSYALSWATNSWQIPQWTVTADTYALDGTSQENPFVVSSVASKYNQQSVAAALDASGDLLVIYSGFGASPNGDGTSTIYTDGGVFGEFYLDPPAPALTTSQPTASTGASSPSGSTTAATDAAFAAYAYPKDDDPLS